jgi:hypothetical protein
LALSLVSSAIASTADRGSMVIFVSPTISLADLLALGLSEGEGGIWTMRSLLSRGVAALRGLIPVAIWCGLSACSQSIVVTSFPVAEAERAKATPLRSTEVSEYNAGRNVDKYWSVFAHIEEQDVPRLWDVSGLDYVLISAKVKLPTRNEPIVREFPLYTIEKGLVQSHSGVDLLKRFPINGNAREQVSISLEVRYLSNEEALKAARVVLKQAEALAEPYLKNFALASQIMTQSVSTIDEALPQERGANTMTIWVDAAEFEGRPKTKAYLLRLMSDVQSRPTYDTTGGELRECSNKPGALCKGKGGYEKARVNDVVYVTLRFKPTDEVRDPLVLFPGSGNCGMISASVLDRVRTYLAANEDLFLQEDVEEAMTAYDVASHYVKAELLVRNKDYPALLDLLNEERPGPTVFPGESNRPAAPPQPLASLSPLDHARSCYDRFWLRSPGREIFKTWALLHDNSAANPTSRFNSIVLMLQTLAGMSGAKYDPQNQNIWDKSSGYVINLLHQEARLLLETQVSEVQQQLATVTCTKKPDFAFSSYCTECRKLVLDKCKNEQTNMIAWLQSREKATLDDARKTVSEVEAKVKAPTSPQPRSEAPFNPAAAD